MALRFGLIGCGGIGQLRADAITGSAGQTLTAVTDIDPARAASVARPHGAAVENDWRTMVRRADVDAVIVSTPPSLHAEMSIEALRAGKHVLCEKPLARNPEECREMIAAAHQSKRLLATGFNYRFYPSILKARELLDSGIIGELDHVRSYTGYSATEHTHTWLHEADTMGGGALRDNGIHLIDLTRYFLGEVASVQGSTSNAVWKFPGCEDNGFAILRSTTGKLASLHASWTEWSGYKFRVEIYGSRGCIRASCFPMTTEVIWASATGGKPNRKRHLFPFVHLMEHLRSYRWVVVKSFIEEMQAFEAAAAGKPSALASGEDGLRTIEIAQAAALRSPAEEIHAGKD